jgi:hypothetical protein
MGRSVCFITKVFISSRLSLPVPISCTKSNPNYLRHGLLNLYQAALHSIALTHSNIMNLLNPGVPSDRQTHTSQYMNLG